MQISYSFEVLNQLKKIKKQDKNLYTRIQKQIILFSQNQKHPSLRLHKLTGQFKNRWSISISRSIRMIYIMKDEDEAYFVAIGTHDQVYRK